MSAGEHIDLGIDGIDEAVPIGAGGAATVYRARQPRLDRTVAVKVIQALDDEHRSRRFEREARALGHLSEHAGIVTVYEVGHTAAGQPYLVMQHCEAGSLQERLNRSGPLDATEAVGALASVAEAVSHAHSRRIMHRDLKPANILVGNDGRFLVADFGIAALADTSAFMTPSVSYTPGYAPPETIQGEPASPASDVYSLGATLYALVTGDHPFAEDGEVNVMALMNRILNEDLPDTRRQGVPDAVAAIIEACTAKDPARRPSMDELVTWLETIRREGVDVTPPATTRAPEPTTRRFGAPPPTPEPAPGPPGRRWYLPAAAALVLVAAAAVVTLVVLDDDDPVAGPGDPTDTPGSVTTDVAVGGVSVTPTAVSITADDAYRLFVDGDLVGESARQAIDTNVEVRVGAALTMATTAPPDGSGAVRVELRRGNNVLDLGPEQWLTTASDQPLGDQSGPDVDTSTWDPAVSVTGPTPDVGGFNRDTPWLWNSDAASGQHVVFRVVLDGADLERLAGPGLDVVNASMVVAGVPSVSVNLDGRNVAANWQDPGQFVVELAPGRHVVAVEASNAAGSAGLLVSVEGHPEANSSRAWAVSPSEPADPGWRENPDATLVGFDEAMTFGPDGVATPWSLVVDGVLIDGSAQWIWTDAPGGGTEPSTLFGRIVVDIAE